jgi:hypothetical protein
MGLLEWENAKIKKLTWLDIPFIKLSVAGFVLMAAKLWTPLLGLEWYWYGLISVVAAAKPMAKMLK